MRRKEKRWNRNLIGAAIIVIMVMSGAGFMLNMGAGQPTDYNGYRFQQMQDGWVTEIDGQAYYFRLHPTQVLWLNVSGGALGKMTESSAVYITFDPNDPIVSAMESTRLALTEQLNMRGVEVVAGVVNRTEEYASFPLIDCADASPIMPVIKIERGTTQIAAEGDCVTISLENAGDAEMALERIIYGLLGVIQ